MHLDMSNTSMSNTPNRGQKRPLEHAKTEPNVNDSLSASKKARPNINSSGATSTSQIGEPSFEQTLGAMEPTEKGEQAWPRPPLPSIDPEWDPIKFQQIDIKEAFDTETGDPLICMFGVTNNGNSVMAAVTGMLPYLYVARPPNFSDQDLVPLRTYLNETIRKNAVHSVTGVTRKALESIGDEDDAGAPFLKITLRNSASVDEVRNVFKHGNCRYRQLFPDRCSTHESELPLELRFMIDKEIRGLNWIEVPASKYCIVPDQSKVSTCQLEITVSVDDFISHGNEGEWSKTASLRIFSFDIECAVRGDAFPVPSVDQVFQISNMVSQYGQEKPFIRNIFAVNTCDPVSGAQVLTFHDEESMFKAWRDFIRKVDPDVIVGYNSTGHGLPYLVDRANSDALGQPHFSDLGRISGLKAQVKKTKFQSLAYSPRSTKDVALQGRLQFDLMRFMHREHNLRPPLTYRLNDVSNHWLHERKEDMHFSMITPLQHGTSETRRRLALYCLKDAYLPLRLSIHKYPNRDLPAIEDYIQRSRTLSMPFDFLVATTDKEPIKLLFNLYLKANERGCLVPDGKRQTDHREYLHWLG